MKEYHINIKVNNINVVKSSLIVNTSTYIEFMNPETLQVIALMSSLFLLFSTRHFYNGYRYTYSIHKVIFKI